VKYLNEIGLLKVFENMDKLAEVPPGNIHGRLRTEIRFVYQLWDAINTETVSLNTFMDMLRCFTCDDKSVPKSINKMFKHRDQ
jgi:Ca2+-binding EF-hand superfamily protein